MRRRDFLRQGALLSLPFLINRFPVEAMSTNPLLHLLAAKSLDSGRVLVLLQLNGGNDGLNTVISLDRYSELTNARANILIPQNKVLTLNGTSATGLHPAMTELQTMYNNGLVNIVQGVSYPNPNFSHFRATDIWLTGAASDQYLTTGWLGRTIDAEYPPYPNTLPPNDPLAIQIGSQASVMTQTSTTNAAFTVTDPSSFYNFVNNSTDPLPSTPYGNELSFLRLKQQQTNQYANTIKTANAAVNPSSQSTLYPSNNSLAQQLKIVARLIKGGLTTPLYIVNHPNSFDTHTGQTDTTDHTIGTHANALGVLSKAINAFQDDLKILGIEDRVTGFTFTEFGRRIKSNGSTGTDHGTAIPMFFFGTKLNPGLTGSSPVLPVNAAVNDQIPMQFDFRSVYYTVLKDWFQLSDTDLSSVLMATYSPLPIFNEALIPPVITSFTGDWKYSQVSLQWTVDQGANITNYEVQRSEVGTNFTTIATVKTQSFQDTNLKKYYYYYRIKINEKKYSTILLLKDSRQIDGVRMKILPNPIDSWFVASFQDRVTGTLSVRMFDLSGHEVWKSEQQVTDAYNVHFDLNKNIMPGVYALKVRDSLGNETTTKVLLRP
ncbi:MAG: DUF1501 domain-containing protein [Bacteroidetes bacterium]|nr:DUF1501 domain-containing protein [Bacteroidota bacterium]